MKGLVGFEFKKADVEKFARASSKKRGIIKQQLRETYTISNFFWSPFRIIHFLDDDERIISKSLFDESHFSLVTDQNEQLLLWRPRYSEVEFQDIPEKDVRQYISNESDLQQYLNKIIEARNEAMDAVMKLDEEYKESQPSHRTVTSLVLPRPPSSLRKQEDIEKRKRAADGWLRAISLMLNLEPEDIVNTFTIGERVYIESMIIHYRSVTDGSERILVLENPVARNLNETKVSGRALTRLAFLNKECYDLVTKNAHRA